MKEITCEPDFQIFLMDKNEQVDLREESIETQIMPTQVYVLPEGTIQNEPSLLFVLKNYQGKKFIAQISARMLRPAILAIRDIKKDY